jgi:hypothetical protein
MKRKPKITPVHLPAPPIAAQVVVDASPLREPWYRALFTDREQEFDTGRVLVAVVILAMCWMQWYDVRYNAVEFDAQKFGLGIAGVLGGFAAYLWGDTRRPPAPVPSTTTEFKQASVTTP